MVAERMLVPKDDQGTTLGYEDQVDFTKDAVRGYAVDWHVATCFDVDHFCRLNGNDKEATMFVQELGDAAKLAEKQDHQEAVGDQLLMVRRMIESSAPQEKTEHNTIGCQHFFGKPVVDFLEKSDNMLKKNNQALLTYVDDLKNLRSIILNDIGAGGTGGQQPSETVTGQAANKENILKKALKCKQLEDDNKKLRKLLKTQIENSEQLRQDTQNTIETLREDFDILVKELLQYKQKDGKTGGG